MLIVERLRRSWRPLQWYGLVIVMGWLYFTAVFLRHLSTGQTPDNVAFTLFGLDVYWYGVIITAGIALGAAIVAQLVAERGESFFQAVVPAQLQEETLVALDLPPVLITKLEKKQCCDLGALLRQWGYDYDALGLEPSEYEALYKALAAHPAVPQSWLEDAPWREYYAEHIWNGIIWVLILAIIGARLYHVFTPSPSMAAVGIESAGDYFRNPEQLFNLRNGGLGIYGGLAGGALGIWLYTRRKRLTVLRYTDMAVIGAAIGQSFGRWGNFFNQEIYGRPTNLPWAITIDPVHRLPAYAAFSRFHPAFLYEGLWNLLTFILLLTLATRYKEKIRVGELTAVYLISYALGRTLLEMVRLDSRTLTIGGLNLQIAVATLVSLVVALLMTIWMVWRRRSKQEAVQ